MNKKNIKTKARKKHSKKKKKKAVGGAEIGCSQVGRERDRVETGNPWGSDTLTPSLTVTRGVSAEGHRPTGVSRVTHTQSRFEPERCLLVPFTQGLGGSLV